MKQRSLFIPVMYWIFKVAFWGQLCITVFVISVDSFDWLGWLHDEPLTYTVRGSFGMYPNVRKPDTTFHQLSTSHQPEVITLVSHSGWARLDYTDLTNAFTFPNIAITLLDCCIWLMWLSVTYLLYKMIESCKNREVFDMVTIKRIRLLALVVGFTGGAEYWKNRIFADVVYSHIGYDQYSIVMKKSDMISGMVYMLLILIIAEVIKYGVSLKHENDLTI